MAFSFTHLAAATVAVANQFVASTNMINGAYTVANGGAMPTAGARRVTVTHTTNTGADTLGTITVAGLDRAGNAITDIITPLAGTIATGTRYFASITSITGAGWVINGGNDTIVVGCEGAVTVMTGSGTLRSVIVNTTAAGAITLADATGVIAVLKASIAEGMYRFDVAFSGFLSVTLAAASDVTVVYA